MKEFDHYKALRDHWFQRAISLPSGKDKETAKRMLRKYKKKIIDLINVERKKMPKPKYSRSYSSTWTTIVKECGQEGKTWTLKVESWKAALSIRATFYAFRAALQREFDNGQLEIEESLRPAQNTACWINLEGPEGIEIKFFHKDNHPQALLLRTAVVTKETQVVDEEAEKLFENMQKRLKEGLTDPTGGKYG